MARNPDSLTKHLIPEDNDKLDLGNAVQVFRTIFVNGLQSASGLTITNPLLLAAGTAALPSLTFAGDVDTGFYHPAADATGFAAAGAARMQLSGEMVLGSGFGVGWSSTAAPVVGTFDTMISRDSAGVLKVTTNGTTLGTLNAGTMNVLAGASATGTTRVGGTLNANITPVGNVTTGDDTLMSYTLPANAMDATGRGVRIIAWGTTANNANAKAVRLYFGATTLGAVAMTVSQANTWRYVAEVLRVDATTQTASEWFIQYGTTILHETNITAPGETLSSAVVIKVTGEGVDTDDITQSGMIVEFFN